MYYLVLDYCDQGSVRRHLRDSGRVTEASARDIIRQLLQAIEYCHSMSQVHRDIKAENVLLKTDPADPSKYIVKLGDFGLSKELDLVSGYLQDVCGTPQYLSPEIVSGRTYGKPADIWSTGILSYMPAQRPDPIRSRHERDRALQAHPHGCRYVPLPRVEGTVSSSTRYRAAHARALARRPAIRHGAAPA
ncbi:hypothetical protein PINS_up024310 [Pythium insidiosum]|nr:hypothetical protein PINS_up024310 [Pythium insidiosum]